MFQAQQDGRCLTHYGTNCSLEYKLSAEMGIGNVHNSVYRRYLQANGPRAARKLRKIAKRKCLAYRGASMRCGGKFSKKALLTPASSFSPSPFSSTSIEAFPF